MDSHSLKRRRPYSQHLSLQDSIGDLASSPLPSGSPVSVIYQDDQLILERAASILGVPFSSLLDLSHQYHLPSKRLRLNSNMHMTNVFPSSGYVHGEASSHGKPSETAVPAENASRERKALVSLPGAESSLMGVTECLGSFPFCNPCSSSLEPQPACYATSASVPYTYLGEKSSPVTSSMGSAQGSIAHIEPINMESNASSLFIDESSFMNPLLSNYPPMEPSRPAESQMPPEREQMIYPVPTSSTFQYYGQESCTDQPQATVHQKAVDEHQTTYFNQPMSMVNPADSDRQAHHPTGHGKYDQYPVFVSQQQGPHARREIQRDFGGPPKTQFVTNQGAPTPTKRGPFNDPRKRQQTAHTRKIGSCIRCRMQRIRCESNQNDEKAPCITCTKVANSKIWRLPCLRWKITDVKLAKPGPVPGHEWTTRWRDGIVLDDIQTWASFEIKVIKVTEGYTSHPVELRVRRFVPLEGDKVTRDWKERGVPKKVEIPPYALVDLDATKASYEKYIQQGLLECCKNVIGPRDRLLRHHYTLAHSMAIDPSTLPEERTLLRNALDLWFAIRLTTKSFQIVGNETLGMSFEADPALQSMGNFPLPPVMGAQIDSVLIHQVQAKLRRDTLENLQKMTQNNKQQTWLTTYLVTFILLHNIALITEHDASYARKHGMSRQFAREDFVKEYNLGANILLAYFHYCNKGIYPFSQDCKDSDLYNLANLGDRAMGLVRFTRQYASEHRREWEQLWKEDRYQHDHYYTSQLYEPNWHPRTMV